MIYFTSDNHFWHTNVIKYCARPYASVEEMNEALIENWNNTVGPNDTIYCLGDFSLAIRPVETITQRLNGIKYLVPGNHDWCHSYNRKSKSEEKRLQLVEKYTQLGWIVLPEQATLDIEGIGTVKMCHHPYHVTHDYDDKYSKWRPENDGSWLLCGHVHESWLKVDKMINVGVDVWQMKPVSIDEIRKIILSEDLKR